jgi:hypothetical protein
MADKKMPAPESSFDNLNTVGVMACFFSFIEFELDCAIIHELPLTTFDIPISLTQIIVSSRIRNSTCSSLGPEFEHPSCVVCPLMREAYVVTAALPALSKQPHLTA